MRIDLQKLLEISKKLGRQSLIVSALIGASNTYANTQPHTLRAFETLNQQLENKPPLYQMHLIDSFINRYAYRSDEEQYGKSDYWAHPSEFFIRGGGDCEDFAIAKKHFLDQQGFDSAYVWYLKAGVPHLAVIVKYGTDIWLLDIQGGTRKITLNEIQDMAALVPEKRIIPGQPISEQRLISLQTGQLIQSTTSSNQDKATRSRSFTQTH